MVRQVLCEALDVIGNGGLMCFISSRAHARRRKTWEASKLSNIVDAIGAVLTGSRWESGVWCMLKHSGQSCSSLAQTLVVID